MGGLVIEPARNMKKTVLLLEDDPNFRDLIRPALESNGMTVLEASTGAEATSFVTSKSPDLIIVDGVLPDIDGIQWIDDLRKSSNQTPVVYVSSYFGHADSYEHLTKSFGVLLIIQKPIEPGTFAMQIRSQLEPKTSGKSMEEKKTNLRDTIANLALRYAAELPTRLNELSDAIQEAKQDPDEAAILLKARSYAHNLRGTSASYGFRQIGEDMAIIENMLLDLISEPVSNQWAEIDQALTRAYKSIESK